MTVADLMCETPVTVRPECTADEALEAFFEFETPELYIVDKAGRLLGVLPDYELLKAELSGEASDTCVEQLMSRSIPVVSLDADAAQVARSFRSCQCTRIPVVKAGRLVGVVTRHDVLRLMAVLRRIDPEAARIPSAPKRPKNFVQSKPATTRTARAKTTTPRASMNRSRSKSVARRAGSR
jgi:Mg/Co/Ni transporter MgtE